MKKGVLSYFITITFCLLSQFTNAQLYGLAVLEKTDKKAVYVSYVFEYKEDASTGYSTSNIALKCSIDNALKIELGSEYKSYKTTLYLRKDRNAFYPYTFNEAKKLRTNLISDFREKDYTVFGLDIVYDKNACN